MRRLIPLVALLVAACAGPFLAPAVQGAIARISITSPLYVPQVPLGGKVDIDGEISWQGEPTAAEILETPALVWFTVEVHKDDWPAGEFVKVSTVPADPSHELPVWPRSWSGRMASWDTAALITRDGATASPVAGKYHLRVVGVVRDGMQQGTYPSGEVNVELTGEAPTVVTTTQVTSGPSGISVNPGFCGPLAIRVLEAPPYTAGTPITFLIVTPADPASCFQTFEWDFGDHSGTSVAVEPHVYAESGSYEVSLTAWPDVARSAPGVTARLTVRVEAAPAAVAVTRQITGFPSCICPDRKDVLVTKDSAVPDWAPKTEVRLTVAIQDSSGTFVLREEIPTGWRMEVAEVEGIPSRQVTVDGVPQREWLLPGDKKTVTITYTLAPEDSAPLKSYPLRGQVITDSSGGSVEIGGDGEITLVSALLVEVAIAHLERTGEGVPFDPALPGSVSLMKPLDAGSPITITQAQVDLAVAYWQSNAVVPFTGGQKVTSETLLKLISWHELGVPQ